MKKAVIDRMVDGKIAVVLVGEDEAEYQVTSDRLPVDAKEGSHLLVEVIDNDLTNIELDNEAMTNTQDRISKKMELLRKKSKRG